MKDDSLAVKLQAADADRNPAPAGDWGAECVESAGELLAVLEQEAEILKRFAGSELLVLVPRKEFLVKELSLKLARLRDVPARPKISKPLRDLLVKIDSLNRSNGVFIRSSLAHWQNLLAILCPQGYGPTAEAVPNAPPASKGLSFSREV